MSDDTIKRALDVAVKAFQEMNGSDPDYNDMPEIAAAIAAFLRALPLMDGVGPEGKSFPIDLTGMAAAIERAAGGGA